MAKASRGGFPFASMPLADPVLRAWFDTAGKKLTNMHVFSFQATAAGHVKEGWTLKMGEDSILVFAVLSSAIDDLGNYISSFRVSNFRAASGSMVTGTYTLESLDDGGDTVPAYFDEDSGLGTAADLSWTAGTRNVYLYGLGVSGRTINISGVLLYAYVEQP